MQTLFACFVKDKSTRVKKLLCESNETSFSDLVPVFFEQSGFVLFRKWIVSCMSISQQSAEEKADQKTLLLHIFTALVFA